MFSQNLPSDLVPLLQLPALEPIPSDIMTFEWKDEFPTIVRKKFNIITAETKIWPRYRTLPLVTHPVGKKIVKFIAIVLTGIVEHNLLVLRIVPVVPLSGVALVNEFVPSDPKNYFDPMLRGKKTFDMPDKSGGNFEIIWVAAYHCPSFCSNSYCGSKHACLACRCDYGSFVIKQEPIPKPATFLQRETTMDDSLRSVGDLYHSLRCFINSKLCTAISFSKQGFKEQHDTITQNIAWGCVTVTLDKLETNEILLYANFLLDAKGLITRLANEENVKWLEFSNEYIQSENSGFYMQLHKLFINLKPGDTEANSLYFPCLFLISE